jgi:cytidylate kinase
MAYSNITVSGLPGCGSTTLLRALKEHLKFEGWTGFSGGEFMRAYAIEKGLIDPNSGLHHPATVYGEDFDREVDFGMRSRLESGQGWILESWLSGFMAQGVPGTLKVLLICSDASVRVDRIVNRDNVSVEEAKKHIQERTEKNYAKWRRMYAQEWKDWVVKAGRAEPGEKVDFWKPELYDIVIDTYSTNKADTLNTVLSALYESRQETAGQ